MPVLRPDQIFRFDLNDLYDTDVPSPSNKELLSYNSTSGKWEPRDESDIDHDVLTNTHNLTTDIDHDTITNTHNLTTDIDHNALTNYVAIEHIDWTDASDNFVTTGTLSAGASDFGDGGTTNYASFAADGELNLFGTARVSKILTIGSGAFHKGSSAPDDGFINDIVHTLDFDKTTTQHGHYNLMIPHDFAAGTAIEVGVDWFFDDAEADHYITWELQYLSLADGEDPATVPTTTYQKSIISTGNNDKQIHTTFATGITGAVADDTLLLRFSRDSDATNDTDDLNQDARLLTVHLHYITDKLGEAIT